MLPTPDTSHVSFDCIYEPAEDSYLLLDTLSSPAETSYLSTRFPSSSATPLVIEVGTGSGVVLAFVVAHARAVLGRSDVLSIGVDINVHACHATQKTASAACSEQVENGNMPGIYLGNVLGDLTAALRPGSVDVLIFNPPYVPTPDVPRLPPSSGIKDTPGELSFEDESAFLALSYAGGEDGMEVTNELLEQIPAVLSNRGIAYVLLCAQNKPADVIQACKERWGPDWECEIVARSGKVGGWEKLCIVRFSRKAC